ncbi:hypothetical protein JCM14722_23540 [Pseudodesulfovibrio portus]|uniref:DNA-binding protein n=1 Tax=Pseudodesulfovibrio portus TaxID=231439 RepID=A0ABM8ATK3_9BACT|nr:hypothetical protein JCM14722_23540 [Pseudodesulfovibrio portus]
MKQINDLGIKMSAKTVSTLFEVEESTVTRYPHRYGGVRIGRRILFFDKLISEAVREAYALQKDKEREEALGRFGNDQRTTQGKDIRLQEGCEGMGSRDAQCGRPDRHSILA